MKEKLLQTITNDSESKWIEISNFYLKVGGYLLFQNVCFYDFDYK